MQYSKTPQFSGVIYLFLWENSKAEAKKMHKNTGVIPSPGCDTV